MTIYSTCENHSQYFRQEWPKPSWRGPVFKPVKDLIDGHIESPYITYNSIPKPNEPRIILEELVESFRLEQLFRTNGK
jgi:hypothetical protein